MSQHEAIHISPARRQRLHLVQGEQYIGDDPDSVVTTILGSCVAACIRDPASGVGGMNHFLLPGADRDDDREATGHGVHAMELLINGLLKAGAARGRLEAKLFGGARMLKGLTDIGRKNAAFAERFLRDEAITYVGGSLGGECARRVEFSPSTGRARQLLVIDRQGAVFRREREREASAPPSGPDGAVELF